MSKERILLGVAAVFVCAGAGVCFAEPVIEVWPSELNFVAVEGGPNPFRQILYISNGGMGKLDWEITEDCEWLSVVPLNGSTFFDETDVVVVSVDITGLSIGEYSCELTISDPDASNSPQVVTVNLDVIGSIIELSQTEFEFTAYDSDPNEQFLYIRNGGTGILNWGIYYNCDWLTVEPHWGSSTGEEDEITLSVDITGLAPGGHDCTLVVYGPGSEPNAINSPQMVDVHLDVILGLPLLDLSETDIEFAFLEGGDNPESQFLTIGNEGGGVLNWEIETSGSCDWLGIGTMSGSLGPGEDEEIILDADISGLSVGEYICELFISAPGAENEPQTVTVSLEIIGPILEVSQLQFDFFVLEGGDNPENQILTIENEGGGVFDWEIETSGSCDWLRIGTMSGSLGAGEEEEILLDVDISGLSRGEYTCDLTVNAPGAENSPKIVNMALYIGTYIYVPEEYPTIQSAIDAAIDGDWIIVSSGAYVENIIFGGKNITLTSTNPNNWSVVESTVIQGTGSSSAVSFEGIETKDCELTGFSITGGDASSGGGIKGSAAHATISNCIITGNTADDHGGGLAGCNGTIENCVISNNTAYGGSYSYSSGGGLYNCNGTINNCTITDNTASFDGGGLQQCDGMISNCTITSNTAGYDGGGLDHCDGMISNCTITGNTAEDGGGGGLYDCDGTIKNCVITNNSAYCEPYSYSSGGGLGNCDGKISKCTVTGNTADYGGGLGGCSGIIEDCTIHQNRAKLGGGGISCGYPCIVRNCIIEDNGVFGEDYPVYPHDWTPSGLGGGGIRGNLDAIIENCEIVGNIDNSYVRVYNEEDVWQEYGSGGGIRGYGDLTIRNCRITGNDGYRYGGGLADCSGIIENCTVNGNQASYGGGLYNCNGTINNVTISNNSASNGGGLYKCNGMISNCAITGNNAVNGDGGMLCNGTIMNCIITSNDGTGLSDCDGPIFNCIITGNMTDYGGKGLYMCDGMIRNCTISDNKFSGLDRCDGTVINCIIWNNDIYDSTAQISYSCFMGANGEGNIDMDPEFVDVVGGDYHLRWDSPCINAGDPNYISDEDEVDIDGEPRVMGGRVDMGADEVGERQADFTRDGRIDISDLSVLSGSWDTAEGEKNWYVLSDLSEDGAIDFSDLAAFVEEWLWVADWVIE